MALFASRFTGITPVHEFGGIWVKREDLAFWSSLNHPSGSKVRQYLKMIQSQDRRANPCLDSTNHTLTDHDRPAITDLNQPHLADDRLVLPNPTIPSQTTQSHTGPTVTVPMIVGCSANSCQQIYIASAAKMHGTRGIIYVPARAKRTDATKYCDQMGAEIIEVRPGYLSVVRKKTRQRVIDLGTVIQWDRALAVLDTAAQCANLPTGIKRIVVPTGSGLTVAGVLIGTAGWRLPVVAVVTSPMAGKGAILQLAQRYLPDKDLELGPLEVIGPFTPYDKPEISVLPDSTPLDPFYAAKAWHLCKPGDLFWAPGLRPVRAMPEDCQKVFHTWKGPA